jgi:hypothetical protein
MHTNRFFPLPFDEDPFGSANPVVTTLLNYRAGENSIPFLDGPAELAAEIREGRSGSYFYMCFEVKDDVLCIFDELGDKEYHFALPELLGYLDRMSALFQTPEFEVVYQAFVELTP